MTQWEIMGQQLLSIVFCYCTSAKHLSSRVARCRRMYWSDCSGTATIQTARIVDGGGRRTLISDYKRSCIVDIAIDFHSTHFSLIVKAKVRLNPTT